MFEIQSILTEGRNKIEATHVIDPKDNYSYVLGLFLIKRFTDEEIFNYYMDCKQLSFSECFSELKNKFVSDQQDSEIQVQIADNYALVLKTVCPITYTKLKYPAKGENCQHIECFSLPTYIAANRKYATFSCPICKKKSVNLVVDKFQMHLFEKLSEDVKDLQIGRDLVAKNEAESVVIDLNHFYVELLKQEQM